MRVSSSLSEMIPSMSMERASSSCGSSASPGSEATRSPEA